MAWEEDGKGGVYLVNAKIDIWAGSSKTWWAAARAAVRYASERLDIHRIRLIAWDTLLEPFIEEMAEGEYRILVWIYSERFKEALIVNTYADLGADADSATLLAVMRMMKPEIQLEWSERERLAKSEAKRLNAILLRCCKCNKPCAFLEDGELVIRTRHSGEMHENRFSVDELVRLAKAETGVYLKA